MTRDKLYDITQGTPGSRIIYFTANPNGEAEIIKVTMEPDLSKKRQSIFLEKDFSDILIKGRAAKGNLLTKRTIKRIGLKSHGHSTLGGRKVWFDPDVNRINYDENGRFLGEFNDDESILVVLDDGDFYITNFDPNNHYEDNILRLENGTSTRSGPPFSTMPTIRAILISSASRWMPSSAIRTSWVKILTAS